MGTLKNRDMLTSLGGGECLWSMRKNILYGLFDLGRLMIDDDRKLKAFHNEVADICNDVYDAVKNEVEQHGKDEIETIQLYYFAGEYVPKDEERVFGLHERLLNLLLFMYGDTEESGHRIGGFLSRMKRIVDTQFQLHYGKSDVTN